MAIDAAWTRAEQLLARHPDTPSELEVLLLQLASACVRLERANADLVQSVAGVPDVRAVRQRGIERRWAEYGGLELWQDGRPTRRHQPEG
jgi:hypothetical protein